MKSIKDLFEAAITFTPEEKEEKKKVGICLSGGSALGFSHIGVLKALEDYNIYPEVVSGSSMGSIIGVFYAAGYKPMQMMDLINDGKLYKLTNVMNFKPAFWKSGLTDHSNIITLLNDLIPNNSFQKLEKEFFSCVSNLTTANWEVISHSNRLDIWIAASMSIPGIFNPLKINDMVYVDGGLLNNMPAQPLKNRCRFIIGSDVKPHVATTKKMKPLDALTASIRVMEHTNSRKGREMCDFLIEPMGIEKHHEFSYEQYQSLYQYGYRATIQFINEHPEIKELQTATTTKS